MKLYNDFNSWFEGSKVTDENNNPLIVYHGTSFSFETFQPNEDGIFFTDNIKVAQDFTGYEDNEIDSFKLQIINDYGFDRYNFDEKDFFKWLSDNGYSVKNDMEWKRNKYDESEIVYGYRISKNNQETFINNFIRFDLQMCQDKSKGHIIKAYLKIINPLIVNFNHRSWENGVTDIGLKVMNSNDYDGAIIYNVTEGDGRECNDYIVKNDNQIWRI